MTDRVKASDPPYLRAAFSMLGLSEIEGERDEPQILEMFKASGHQEIKDDETAWCAAFVGWSLKEGGLPNTKSLLAISYAKYGVGCNFKQPIPRGAIAVWHRTGGNHVNFVLADDGTYVTCIGGNQSNGKGGGVTISRRLKSEAIAYRMPQGVVVPLPKPKSTVPAPTDNPAPQKPKPSPAPSQDSEPEPPQPDDDESGAAKPGWVAKLRNWAGGLFTSGGLFYMDWRLGAALVVLIILLIAFLLWLFGKGPIKAFIKRHLGSGG